jgi:hypothetical protein
VHECGGAEDTDSLDDEVDSMDSEVNFAVILTTSGISCGGGVLSVVSSTALKRDRGVNGFDTLMPKIH